MLTDMFHRARRIWPNGIITTVAGTSTNSNPGASLNDGGPAVNAGLNYPWGTFGMPDGSILVMDTSNNRVRRVAEAAIRVTQFYANGNVTEISANLTIPSSAPLQTCFFALNSPTPLKAQLTANGFTVSLVVTPLQVACASWDVSSDPLTQCANSSCCTAATWTCKHAIDAGIGWTVGVTGQIVNASGTFPYNFPSAFGIRFNAPPSIAVTLAATLVEPLPTIPGQALVCGPNMGYALSAVMPYSLLWTPFSVLLNSSFYNATCILSYWNITADPLPWLYIPGAMSFSVGNSTAATIPALLSNSQPSQAIINASNVQWGDAITITAPLLATLQVVNISLSAGNVSLPCSAVKVKLPNALICTLRYAANAWIGRNLSIALTLNGRVQPYVLSLASSPMFVATQRVSASISSWSSQQLQITFGTTLPTQAILAADGVAPGQRAALASIAAWVGGLQCPSCTQTGSAELICSLPTGADTSAPFTVQVGRLLNITAPITSLLGAVVVTPSPFRWGQQLMLSGSGLGDLTPVNMSILLEGDAVGTALPCSSPRVINSSTIACTPRLIREAWVGRACNFLISYANVTLPLRLLASHVNATAAHTTADSAFSLVNASVATVNITFPAPVVVFSELSAAALPGLVSYRAWVDGVDVISCMSARVSTVVCTFLSPGLLTPVSVVTLEVSALFNVTANVRTATASDVDPTLLGWEDTVTLTVPGITATDARAVFLQLENSLFTQLPCTSVSAAGPSSVQCSIHYLHHEWLDAGASMAALIVFDSETAPIFVFCAGLTFSPPLMPAVTVQGTDAWLSRAGSTTITFMLPQPMWSASEMDALPAFPGRISSCTAWLENMPCIACSITSPTTGIVMTPANWLPQVTLLVELAGLVNVSSGSLPVAYEPPKVTAITPGTLFAAADASNAHALVDVALNVEQLDARPMANYLSGFEIGGVDCSVGPITSNCDTSIPCYSTINCLGLDMWRHLQIWPGIAAAVMSLNVSYVWANRVITTAQFVELVRRPELTSVSPVSVQAGAALIMFGFNLAPVVQCEGNMRAFVGGAECVLSFVQPGLGACRVPDLAPAYASQTNAVPVVVESCLGLRSTELITVSYPSMGNLTCIGRLPTEFIPSTLATPIALDGELRFRLTTGTGDPVASGSCSLTSSELAAMVLPITRLTLNAVPLVNGTVDFGPVLISSTYDTPFTVLTVVCTSTSSSDTFPSLTWNISLIPVTLAWCEKPATLAAAQTTLQPWSVVAVLSYAHLLPHAPLLSTPSSPNTCPALVGGNAVGALVSRFPALTAPACQVVMPSSAITSQGALASAAAATSIATFPSFALSGVLNATVSFHVTCTLHGVALLPDLSHTLFLTGCAPGQTPFQATCVPCSTGTFSAGGVSNCTGCPPVGATCTGGVVSLQKGFYMPPSIAGREIGPDTELHACFNEQACTLNESTLSYGCATGYTGPLCGVCDADADYSAFGKACAACWPRSSSVALIAAACAVFISALTFVAVRKTRRERSEASIALRILLTFIQAVSSLRAFKASGTKAYYNIMGFSDAVSVSPLSLGPVQCVVRQTYIGQYVFIILLPAIAAAGVVLMFLLSTLVTSIKLRPNLRFDLQSFKQHVAAWHSERRHLSALLFVAQLAYMPIVNASLRALDCVGPIAGVSYLRADLSVACTSDSSYAGLVILAVTVLCLMGVGFPVIVFVILRRAQTEQLQNPQFRGAWGFLFDGYRLPSGTLHKKEDPGDIVSPSTTGSASFAWWESLVLLRKAGIVMLAVLITDEQAQIVGATLWLVLFLVLQAHFSPYSRSVFNYAEMGSLGVMVTTAVLSALLLNSGTTAASTSTSAVYNSEDSIAGLSVRDAVVTAMLVTMNVVTMSVLAMFFLYLRCKTVTAVLTGKAKGASSKSVISTSMELPDAKASGGNTSATPHRSASTRVVITENNDDFTANPIFNSRASMHVAKLLPDAADAPVAAKVALPNGVGGTRGPRASTTQQRKAFMPAKANVT
jgi:hypothetical protein